MKNQNEKSYIMAERLKQLREEKGYSHEKLSNALNERYGIKISSDSLMNYEVSDPHHTKAGKNQGMRVEYLRCLADFYGVSSDYLLGISDISSPSIDVQALVKYTGLSESNIRRLGLAKQYAQAMFIHEVRCRTSGEDFEALQDKLLELCKFGKMNETHIGIAGSCANFVDLIDDLIKAAAQNESIPASYGSLVSAANSEFEIMPELPVEVEGELASRGMRALTNYSIIRFESSEISKEINAYLTEKFLKKYHFDDSENK